MAVSGFMASYAGLRERIARKFGYSRTPGNWTPDHLGDIADALKDGLQLFYEPPGLRDGSGNPLPRWKWSFLISRGTLVLWLSKSANVLGTPGYSVGPNESTIDTAADQFYPSMVGKPFRFTLSGVSYTIKRYNTPRQIFLAGDASGEGLNRAFTITNDGDYTLSEDFTAFKGDKLDFSSNSFCWSIQLGAMSDILYKRGQQVGVSIRPWLGAVGMLPWPGTTQQLSYLAIYPTPTEMLTLNYQYHVQPDLIGSTNIYPLGGSQHGATIQAACLAAAEKIMDDGYGAEYQDFLTRLAGSIATDRLTKPTWLGNGSRSDAGENEEGYGNEIVKYNGVATY